MWLSDEEYVYQQDIKEKKSAGRGIFHKKGGSKSKKCTLPSDYMTKKEREAMNGEVFSYNPNNWYTWEEFKTMPMEYQVKYVNSLLNRYNCSFSAIAKYVFKVTDIGLRTHFTRRDQLQYINMPSVRSGKSLLAGNDKLRCDYESAINAHEDHPEEIQNGSGEATEIQEPTYEDLINAASEKVSLYANNGVPMTPERIDDIYKQTVGVGISEIIAEGSLNNNSEPIDEDIINPVETVEDPTDVQSFSIVMDHIDKDIVDYIAKLFEGKKVSVSIDVKQWYTSDQMES